MPRRARPAGGDCAWSARGAGSRERRPTAGKRLARRAARLAPGSVLVAGGETVVRLGPRRGRGGRCLELALGAAPLLAERADLALLAAGSDGLDGSSGAAGAWLDAAALARARRRRADAGVALQRHDTRAYFRAAGSLFVTGPTGTNVGDWVFLLRRKAPAATSPPA